MTLDEHAERALAELDREGLSSASAADAPRIRAIIADAIHAAVAEERERAAGWLWLAFAAIDRDVPIKHISDELDDVREFLAEFRRARGQQGGASA